MLRNTGCTKDRPCTPSLTEGTWASERKLFFLTLKENPRGRFLRISEEVGSKRNSIIIPATGLLEFQKLLAEMIQADGEIPAKDQPPAGA